jgi:hypothetical protein
VYPNKGPYYVVAASALLCLWGYWLAMLDKVPGADGYYLLEQARFVIQTGALKIHNHDPTPYLLAIVIKAGLQPETAAKTLLFVCGIAWLWLGRKAHSAFFFIVSPLFFYHLVQFPKLSIALMLAAAAWTASKTPWKCFFAAASLSFHPLAFLCFLVPWLGRFGRKAMWWGSFGLILTILAVGYFMREGDLKPYPVGYKFLTDPNFPGVLRICIGLWMAQMLLVLGASSGWIALGLLAPTTAGELFGASERLVLATILLSPWFLRDEKRKLPWGLLSPWLCWLILSQIPRHSYELVDKVISQSDKIGITMLVSDQTDKFYFTYKTGQDGYFFEPEDTWPRKGIWRLAQNVSAGELLPYMRGTCGPGAESWYSLSDSALLISEDCWKGIRSQISKDDNEDLYARVWNHFVNPSKKRPKFLSSRLQ